MPQLFWCWKAPPQTCPPKSPPCPRWTCMMTPACLSCKFHVMSYMDMMPRSWQDIPCSDMTCHTWTCHGHGTSCHVRISCDHDMTSSTWSRSCSQLIFNHSFLEDWFQTPFGFEELAASLSLRWKCETVESTMALNIATFLDSSPFNSSFWTASLTSWSDKALGSDSSIKFFTNFLTSSLKSRWSGDSSVFFGIPAGAGQWASVNVAWIWDTHDRHASPWW